MSISATTLNAIGLGLNLVGAVLLFLFGVPAHLPPEAARQSFLVLEQDDPESERASLRSIEWSKWGMFLLGVGFVVQLVALYR